MIFWGGKKKRKDIFSLSSFFWDSFSSSLTIRSGSAVPSQRSYIPRASPLCSGYFYGSISDSWNGIRRRLEPWDSYIYTYVRTLTRNTLAWQNCNRGHHLEPIQGMDQFRLVGVAMCAAPDGWCSFQRFVESVLDIVYRARRISDTSNRIFKTSGNLWSLGIQRSRGSNLKRISKREFRSSSRDD